MGRFTPGVLPDYRRDPGEDLARAIEEFQGDRDRSQATEDAHRRSAIGDILSGYRPGEPPAPMDEVPRASRGSAMDEVGPQDTYGGGSTLSRGAGSSLADAMGGGSGRPQLGDLSDLNLSGHPAATGEPGVRLQQDRPRRPPFPDLFGGRTMADVAPIERGVLKAGAFDVVSGKFATAHGTVPLDHPADAAGGGGLEPDGGSPASPAGGRAAAGAGGAGGGLDPKDRYVRAPGGYVDTQGGSAYLKAVAEMDARAALAADNERTRTAIANAGNTSRATVAAGQNASREGVAAAGNASREGVASANRKAALDRLERQAQLSAGNSAAHDARVTARGPAGGGAGKARTPGQQATWAKTMSDGVISMFDGDLSAAEDFLSNDVRGQGYQSDGLSVNDLYAAAGRYRNIEAKGAESALNAGAAGSPADAAKLPGSVRGAPSPAAAGRTAETRDAALAEAKAAFDAGEDTPARRAKYNQAVQAINTKYRVAPPPKKP